MPDTNGTQTKPQAPGNGNTQQSQVNVTPTMTEAPFSWNTTVISADGFVEMFTVRASNQQPFLDRVASLKKNLIANNYKPAVQRAAPSGTAASANAETEQAPLCAIHHDPMKQRTGNRGEKFWSCAHKLEDGTWCPYRPKK